MDLARLREEFPVTRNYNFLDHAAVGPLSRRAVAAVEGYLQQQLHDSYIHVPYFKQLDQGRQLAAQLIHANPDEIAFVKSTSEGLSFVANGLKWNAGDNIVTAAVEFPSNVYPWMNLQTRGVQLRTVLEENGRIPMDNLIEAIDSHTRVVTISAVQYASGFRIDLAELGRWCQKRGVLFCVDAIQMLGVLPIDVQAMHIDFLSSAGHKWLCGPAGCGIFYCNRELIGYLRPSTIGWHSVKQWDDFAHHRLDFHDDARRFEPSGPIMPSLCGLNAAMELILEIGIDSIAQHVLMLTDRLVAGVRDKGYRVVSPREEDSASGIVTFTSLVHDPYAIQKHLANEHRIITSVRQGRLRISPHLYNSPEEIDRLVELLPKH
ncbi:MAG: Cysteine desulfurase SufS [Phycisphaerae bacterium]|nr:Cysteine desulfurase SufS [Phycisphaerae bacterium]